MRRPYVKPAIEAEEYLEQTSLACNLTREPPYGWGGNCGQLNLDDYRKGGGWMEQLTQCTEVLVGWERGCGPDPEYGEGVLYS